jgi:hypothetical protein
VSCNEAIIDKTREFNLGPGLVTKICIFIFLTVTMGVAYFLRCSFTADSFHQNLLNMSPIALVPSSLSADGGDGLEMRREIFIKLNTDSVKSNKFWPLF